MLIDVDRHLGNQLTQKQLTQARPKDGFGRNEHTHWYITPQGLHPLVKPRRLSWMELVFPKCHKRGVFSSHLNALCGAHFVFSMSLSPECTCCLFACFSGGCCYKLMFSDSCHCLLGGCCMLFHLFFFLPIDFISLFGIRLMQVVAPGGPTLQHCHPILHGHGVTQSCDCMGSFTRNY